MRSLLVAVFLMLFSSHSFAFELGSIYVYQPEYEMEKPEKIEDVADLERDLIDTAYDYTSLTGPLWSSESSDSVGVGSVIRITFRGCLGLCDDRLAAYNFMKALKIRSEQGLQTDLLLFGIPKTEYKNFSLSISEDNFVVLDEESKTIYSLRAFTKSVLEANENLLDKE